MDFNFGTCCCKDCAKQATSLVTVNKKGPVPGKGWGCYVCHLPSDGAMAAVCEDCLKNNAEIVWVIFGWAAGGERVLLASLTEPFEHDMRFHPEACVN